MTSSSSVFTESPTYDWDYFLQLSPDPNIHAYLKGFIKDKNDYIDYVIKYRELRKSLCTIKSHIRRFNYLLSDEIHNDIINKTICHNLHNLTLSYLFGLRLVSSLHHVMEPYRIENCIRRVDIWNTSNGLRIKSLPQNTSTNQ